MVRLAIAAMWGLSLLIAASCQAATARGPTTVPFRGAAIVPPSGPPIVLHIHQGTLLRPPGPVSTVFVADSDIADVTIKTPSLIYITAKKIGETVIYAVDANDRVLVNKRVEVEYDLPTVLGTLQRLLPGQLISAHSVGQDVVLTGTVTTAEAAYKAVSIAAQTLGIAEGPPVSTVAAAGAKAVVVGAPPHIVNQLVVATPNQINLRVRIASVNLTALKQVGITLGKTFIGRGISFSTAPLALPGTNTLGVFEPLAHAGSISATLDLLATEGFATTLAEPNLTALSGEKASFGVVQTIQIPGQSTAVTTVSSSGATSTTPSQTTTSTQPLSAGVTLDFVATILDANHINLKLRPEVSSFNFSTTTTINGTTIPEQDQTVAQTTVDLASGQSFALAGLLQRNISEGVNKVPGLGDIPWLGALFRSQTYNSTETELVIVVTPYIVKPMMTVAATPLAGFRPPDDLSQVLLGSKYRQTLPAPAQGPLGAGGQALIGPVGFRLD